MYRVIYFKNTKNFHDFTIYQNALRIPEVFLRLRQTLNELDKVKKFKNLFHLLSVDEDFFEQPSNKLKSLNADFWHIAMTIIQVGLYDHYLKSQMRPFGFITPSSSDWAAKISGGLWTITDMIENLQARKKMKNSDSKRDDNTLSFFKYNKESDKHDDLISDIQDFKHLSEYIEKYHISQIIAIGPNISAHSSQRNVLQYQRPKTQDKDWLLNEIKKSKFLSDNICVIESIDLDPLLFWFWKDCDKILRQKQNFSFIKSNYDR